jgi:polyphosphate kinase 2 (PPK2 family)
MIKMQAMLNVSHNTDSNRNNVIPFAALKLQPSRDQLCFAGSKNKDICIGTITSDNSPEITKKQYKQDLQTYQSKLVLLQQLAREKKLEVIMVYEGWDAAGKGGAIKRVTEKLDPRGVKVFAIGAPTPEEKNHQYLWRFWNKLQGNGVFTIFDRSWYGRVLVERVEKFATPKEWKRAYKEINHFEKSLTDNGALLLKFFIDVSKDEQLKRFEDRKNDPLKAWKLTDEDWRNREKWDQYRAAIKDMYLKTNNDNAQWFIIKGDSKHYARIQVLKTITEALEKKLDVDPDTFYPDSIKQ